jgi:hypothetical protein
LDLAALQQSLDGISDQALVRHGFTAYMRDYELMVYRPSDPRSGIPPDQLRYLFRHCVVADVRSALRPETWRCSFDDRLTDHSTGVDLDGFVWGVNWQSLYPGATLIPDSDRARHWSETLGIDFHEVRIEANAHDLTLVFSDLQVTQISPAAT